MGRTVELRILLSSTNLEVRGGVCVLCVSCLRWPLQCCQVIETTSTIKVLKESLLKSAEGTKEAA